MANTKLVDVVDARNQFLEVLASHLLLQALVLDNQVEELASLDELHDQVQVLLSLDDFVDLDHVGVVQLLENLNLAADALDVLFIFDARLLEHLDGHLLAS